MPRAIVGIMGNSHLINDQYLVHGTGRINSEAVSKVTGAVPLVVPSDPDIVSVDDLMEACDGFVFTGGRPNVHPEEYGEEPTEAHGDFDRCRDRLALPLITRCVEAGQPVLGICRGFQEFNVAFGGSLHPEIRDLPGRMNHRMPPDGTMEEKFALRHSVDFLEGTVCSGIFGSSQVVVNSLHGQGIKEAGPRVVIEGHAPDGTPEAMSISGAPGFAVAVQWHPEWNAENNAVSRCLFEAFAKALADWRKRRSPAAGRRPEELAAGA